MIELEVNTSLTMEEIENNFKDVDFFSGIMEGLEEALAYEKGNAKASTYARKKSLPTINVSETRKSLNLSQKSFAEVLGVSSRTVEAWESGRSNPNPTAVNLIYLIDCDNGLVKKLQKQR